MHLHWTVLLLCEQFCNLWLFKDIVVLYAVCSLYTCVIVINVYLLTYLLTKLFSSITLNTVRCIAVQQQIIKNFKNEEKLREILKCTEKWQVCRLCTDEVTGNCVECTRYFVPLFIMSSVGSSNHQFTCCVQYVDISVTASYTLSFATYIKNVKLFYTHYRALGPELIPVYKQSARRWLLSHLRL